MRLVLALSVAALMAGCASLPGTSRGSSSPPSRSTATGDDAVLRTRIHELQQQAAMAEAEITLLRRQLAELTVEVERLASSDPVAPARPFADAPSVSGGAAPPAMEQTDLAPERVEPLATPPPPIEAPPAEVIPAPSTMPAPAPSGGANEPVSMAGQAVYDQGYTLYHQGRYLDAEASFQRFLQAHGNTDLADNAQFWIGESRFARRDYSGAMLAFQEVLDRFPGGNKGADALLKVGDCLERLDDRAGARRRFEEVLERYPGSAASVMAQERLGQLGG